MKRINFWSRKLYRRAIQLVGSSLYLNPEPNINRSILVAGTARSGTVWLADLIASQVSCRIMFEPFNPYLVPEYREFHYFQYMRPGSEDKKLYNFAHNVFTGKIRNPWIDHQNEKIFSKFRLVKEIRANLLLKWLHDNFPEVPIVFLIRHPCAVVLSRMQLGWATNRDIEPFLTQSDLVADYLRSHLDLIRNLKTDEEKHAVIWSISNLVPLKQFALAEIKIVYYEHLCTQPETELPSIFEALRHEFHVSAFDAAINRPSVTARENSPIVTGTDKINNWRKKLTSAQIDRILRIVEAFGLGHLYSDSLLPLKGGAA